MKEKSAFELLSELYNGQKALSTRMVNLEEAILLILKELREKEDIVATVGDKKALIMKVPNVPQIIEDPGDKPAKNIRVIGTIKSEENKGVSGVKITFYDDRNNAFKNTITNKAGQYISFMPPGKYSVHCLNEDPKIDKNINFEVNPSDKEVNI
jgi:hypothetical protein